MGGPRVAIARTFRELDVYKLAREQAKQVFQLTTKFPREETYSLTDQVRRSSRAVNAMIAEAWARRRYPAVFVNKLSEALGEATETQAWLDHAAECGYIDAQLHSELDAKWQSIGAMLFRMMDRTNEFCHKVPDSRAQQ